MIKNVNLLQNPIEYDKYSEEFLIQALANLGQRVGIKGDGIAYRYFTFNDLLTNAENSNLSSAAASYKSKYNTDKIPFNIGYIQYVKTDKYSDYIAKFGVKQIDPDTGEFVNDIFISNTRNINNILYFNKELSFDIPIGGVEKYAKNSICINDGDELTFMLAGKHIGAPDNSDFNTILYYYKFDVNTNLLKYAAKISQYNSDISGEYVSLITIVNSLYKENNYSGNTLNDQYELKVNILNLKNIENYSKNGINLYKAFKNIFNFNSYKETNEIPFSLLKPEYVDVNELYTYNEDPNQSYDNNSPIAVICNLLNNITVNEQKVDLTYNTNNNEFLAVDETIYEATYNYFIKEYKLNINEELFIINEDINKLYFNIFSYYDDQYFLSSKKAFIQTLLLKLYEKLLSENYTTEILYIPFDYKFNYICNSNNEMNIYYSLNTYVSCLNLDNINDKQNFWLNNDNLIYTYKSDLNKVKAFNFEVNYNKYDNSLINSIDAISIFTLPYINANNNWSIDNSDTKIKAVGKDAGNPNIIIIYNHDDNNTENSYTVLNAISHHNEINKAKFNKTYFNIHNALFKNVTNDSTNSDTNDSDVNNAICCAYIPEINKLNIEYFSNSIILSVSDLNCITRESYRTKYKGNYVFTIWHLTENENGTTLFDYIRQPELSNIIDSNEYALVLGSATNILEATNDNSVSNLNDYDLLLLKAIVTELGQENLKLSTNNWFLIKNKQSEEYEDAESNILNYENDLNAIFQFNDNVYTENNHAIYSQKKRYISKLNNLAVTNSLYPQYNVYTKEYTITNDNQLELKEIDSIITSRISSVYVNGEQVLNTEKYVQYIQEQLQEVQSGISQTIEIKTITNGTTNYDEYVFNENVPTIDFAEVFNRNFNVLNRINIVSLDELGQTYNAFIGTSFNESNKSTLHIGTSEKNINIGYNTLLEKDQYNEFYTHDTLSLDFDNIVLNATKTLTKKSEVLTQKQIGNITYNYSILSIFELVYTSISALNGNVVLRNNFDARFDNKISQYKINLTNLFKKYFNYIISLELNNDTGEPINVKMNIKNILSTISSNTNSQDNTLDPIYYYINDKKDIYLVFNRTLITTNDIILSDSNSEILCLLSKFNIVFYKNSNSILNINITLH